MQSSTTTQQQVVKLQQGQSPKKPVLIGKIEGGSSSGITSVASTGGTTAFTDDLNDALLIPPNEDGVITAGDDKTVQVWLKRDSGQYWPSICQYTPSQATCLFIYHKIEGSGDSQVLTRIVYIGLENGTIMEYSLSEDCNKLEHRKDYLSHHGRVTSIIYIPENASILSVSRDKTFQWTDSKTSNSIANQSFSAWCTALQYDHASGHAFIGDYSGQITMLKLIHSGSNEFSPSTSSNNSTSTVQMVTTFKGHNGSIRSLRWDASSGFLFSGSFDQVICAWDIGGKKGVVYELQGHKGKVTGLAYLEKSKILLSASEDSIIVAWNMNVGRNQTAEWLESDSCQICNKPFFWNLRRMVESFKISSAPPPTATNNQNSTGSTSNSNNKKSSSFLPQRQHHCRSCGKAVCDRCSTHRSTLPKFGFEFEVRICDLCKSDQNESNLTASTATFHEAKHSIISMNVDENRGILVTVGSDRIIKIWDISSIS